jgi:hypothetical protein
MDAVGWSEGVVIEIFEGPGEYLYGEETGLLEVIDGRHPFPRVAPPYRHGVDEVGAEETDAPPTPAMDAAARKVMADLETLRSYYTNRPPRHLTRRLRGNISHSKEPSARLRSKWLFRAMRRRTNSVSKFKKSIDGGPSNYFTKFADFDFGL